MIYKFNLIDPLTTYVESRACEYSFKVGCGNQSVSFDYLKKNSNPVEHASQL